MLRPLVFLLPTLALLAVPQAVLAQATASPSSTASSNDPAYRLDFMTGEDGKPVAQLTNYSGVALAAFVMTQSPEHGLESRRFYDVCVFPQRDTPIAPGSSFTERVGPSSRDPKGVRTEVRAVVLEDGSNAGDPAWIDALLAMRLRFYDRLGSLRTLISQQAEAGASRDALIEKLHAAEASVDLQLPNDELRSMDDVSFHGAISTFQANEGPVGNTIKVYLQYLDARIADIDRCQPGIDAIRARLAQRLNPDRPTIPPPLPH